jgi:carboxymethylenebutenolidase
MLHPEVDSLVPRVPFNRRRFLGAALGTGFAAAVLPVGAQTIHTDDAGLSAGEVAVPVPGGVMPAYRAQPAGATHLPVIVVVHEIFGVHEHIADVCRRFAKLGYLAIAPELYFRQGDARRYTSMQQLNDELVSRVPDAQVMSDLDATLDWAVRHGGDARHAGMTGFCWGGRIAWLYAERSDRIRTAVAWYGRLRAPDAPRTPQTPAFPLDLVETLKVPVLGMYGGQDASIPADSIATMKAAIGKLDGPARDSEFVVYPDAPHAFFADYRPSYREADARDGWRRCVAWFAAHGVAATAGR